MVCLAKQLKNLKYKLVEYLFHILILINIYIIIAITLNLVSGFTGLLSLAHAAFYGIGAYATSLMWLYLGTGFWINIIVGMVSASLFAFVIAFPSLKIYDDYFAIATFGLQMIVFSILNNWVEFTKGPLGIPGIPAPKIFSIKIASHFAFFVLSGVFVLIVYLLVRLLVNSPFGLILKAIREDEVFTKSAGKNVINSKIYVFIISGSFVSIAGALYAHYVSFIDPSSFTINESIFMISIVIIGGMASLHGSIIGAIIMIIIPELLRFIGLPNALAANLRQIFYGILLIILMLFRPQGILGEDILLKSDKNE